ncbi:hypothetical protein ACI65C_008236 [Semiaphis heraclei]
MCIWLPTIKTGIIASRLISAQITRHAAVSVDANPSASPAERQTTTAAAAASTAVVGDTQQQKCTSAAVTLNDHHQCDSQQSVVATAVAADSPRDSQGVTCNKTESATTTTTAAAAAATSLSRPICPNLPYSPACSPRFARRRPPLRECRVSVNVQSLDDPNAHQKLNQYKLIDSIGQGSYGLVKLAYNELDDKHYAMKILSKKKLMKKAGCFVFELLERGEVMQVPGDPPMPESKARSYFRDILLGLEYLHFQRIVHRDIKPSNLLIDASGHVKIADLGVCNEFDGSDDLLSSSAGTPAFTAPEVLDPSTKTYSGRALDVWALGCTLYAFIYGRLPYTADTVLAVHEQIRTQPVQWPVDPETSPQLVHLLHRLLDKDPDTRITLPAVKKHDWVTRAGAETLPTERDNYCQEPVEVSEEEMMNVVKSIPKLNTLILIKAMLKNHSFLNPFSADESKRKLQSSNRSHSAPGACSWFGSRSLSAETTNLQPVKEYAVKEK